MTLTHLLFFNKHQNLKGFQADKNISISNGFFFLILRLKERQKRKMRKKERPPGEPTGVSRKKLKDTTMSSSKCKVSVVIDLAFEAYMDEKSITKCIKQVGFGHQKSSCT